MQHSRVRPSLLPSVCVCVCARARVCLCPSTLPPDPAHTVGLHSRIPKFSEVFALCIFTLWLFPNYFDFFGVSAHVDYLAPHNSEATKNATLPSPDLRLWFIQGEEGSGSQRRTARSLVMKSLISGKNLGA